jgi:hypothetical protein
MATKTDKKVNGKATEKTEATSKEGLIPLKRVCADLGIKADCATRAKLRRVWRDENDGRIKADEHKLKHRWDLTPSQVKRAKEILAPSA